MKARYLIALLLILAAGSGCRTLKERQRQQEKTEHSQRLEWRAEHMLETGTEWRRGTQREDSLWHAYQVLIYPLDSFRYDPQTGFIGKAAKIELSGSLRAHSLRRDTVMANTRSRARSQSTGRADTHTQSRNTATDASVKRTGYLRTLLVLLMALAAFVYIKRYRQA